MGLLSMLTARQAAFPLSSAHVSVPVHILHHHPCTSWCPQHHTAMICTQLQPWRERGGADAGVLNTSSSHKQHKGKRGEGEEGRREGGRKDISLFSVLNSSLLECGSAAIPPAWMSLRGNGCETVQTFIFLWLFPSPGLRMKHFHP